MSDLSGFVMNLRNADVKMKLGGVLTTFQSQGQLEAREGYDELPMAGELDGKLNEVFALWNPQRKMSKDEASAHLRKYDAAALRAELYPCARSGKDTEYYYLVSPAAALAAFVGGAHYLDRLLIPTGLVEQSPPGEGETETTEVWTCLIPANCLFG